MLSCCVSVSAGTRKAAALFVPPDGVHNLHRAARVPGHSAGRSEHLQPHNDRESAPQAPPRGERLTLRIVVVFGLIGLYYKELAYRAVPIRS